MILCYTGQPGKKTTDLNRMVHRFHPVNIWTIGTKCSSGLAGTMKLLV
jgi:hypothetical protein